MSDDLPPDYKPPTSAEELLERYGAGERRFPRTVLRHEHLADSKLQMADLTRADLTATDFHGAKLSYAVFRGANLSADDLRDARLVGADLAGSDLSDANLSGADLAEANLSGSRLSETRLAGAHLAKALFAGGSIVNCDLRSTVGLELTHHAAPTSIGHDTLRVCRGGIPDAFLRGCGLQDWEIEAAKLYDPSLSSAQVTDTQYRIYDLRVGSPVRIDPLFISYSHHDAAFIDALEVNLNERHIRFWRDKHHMVAGRMESQIDRALRLNPLLLLVLSEHSLGSDWVEHEVREARELEKKLKRDVLCPIALDEAWKDPRWPKRLMEQIREYNILDFSGWRDLPVMAREFEKLVRGLKLFYEPIESER